MTELTFTDIEANICTIARMIEEDKLYFVQMSGPPLFAVLLAKRMRIPDVGYLVEEGAIAPSPTSRSLARCCLPAAPTTALWPGRA